MKGVLTGLKSLRKLAEDQGGESRGSSFLKLKDGENVTVRFLQELDSEGKYFDADRGLAVSSFEHFNPDNYKQRFLCTSQEEGSCVGCERVAVNNRWKKRSRLYVNAYVVDDKSVKIVTTGFSNKGLGSTLIEYAEDFGTLCDRNYKLKRKGEGLQTQYSLLPREVSEFDLGSVELNDLEPFMKYRSYEECLALVNGEEQNS